MKGFGIFGPPEDQPVWVQAIRPKPPRVVLRARPVIVLRRAAPVESPSSKWRTKDEILTMLDHLHHHRECCCQRCKKDGNPLPRLGCICPTCFERKPKP